MTDTLPERAIELAAMLEPDPANEGGHLYTGPLDDAKRVLEHTRYVSAGLGRATNGAPVYEVLFASIEPVTWGTCDEWGMAGPDEPELAWRRALGAFFDPAGDVS